jgi:hypothetical protein
MASAAVSILVRVTRLEPLVPRLFVPPTRLELHPTSELFATGLGARLRTAGTVPSSSRAA